MKFSKIIDLLFKKINRWLEDLVHMLPNLILAFVVFFIFYFLGKLLKNLTLRVLDNFSENKAVNRLMTVALNVVIVGTGLFAALGILQLDKTVTSLLAGAGVIGLAIGFAFQEIASNFIAGVLIAFIKPYRLGDLIKIDNYEGVVENINLRTTNVETFQGLEVIIPNKDMFTKPIVNYSSTPKRRIDLKVGVHYSTDLSSVEGIIKNALQDLPGRLDYLPIDVYFTEFADSSINLVTQVWVRSPHNKSYMEGVHNCIIRIKKAFDENGITIPFPIRTLDFPKAVEIRQPHA